MFGGATVADLDLDGYYDLILTYHNKYPIRVYYGSESGKFTRERDFIFQHDIHGISVASATANSSNTLVAIPVGGGGGGNLRHTRLFQVGKERSWREVGEELGLNQLYARGRGRVPVWMEMWERPMEESRKNGGGPDLLVVNLLGVGTELVHYGFRNVEGKFQVEEVSGIKNVNEERAIVTDVDGDGKMEVVHFSTLRIWRVTNGIFKDVTSEVWKDGRELRRTVSAVCEGDFNNDGLMDLYVARANSSVVTKRGPPGVDEYEDVVLWNRGGWYEEGKGLQGNINSMGVSAEDFDNDGYVDVIISTWEGEDVLLMNNKKGGWDGLNPGTEKHGTRGASIIALDYDDDGRMDYLTGLGWQKEFVGNFRLMRNMMGNADGNGFVKVKVGDEPTGACTRLNAIVEVYVGRRKMVRRVGGRGAGAGGLSLIDTLHFGVGKAKVVRKVKVKWTCGSEDVRKRVQIGSKVEIGIFGY